MSMSKNTDLALKQVFGCPAKGASKWINTSTGGTATSTSLTVNAIYRLVSTEDCYFHFDTSNGATCTSTDSFLVAGVPECFTTDSSYKFVSAISGGTTGKLNITRLTE